MAHCHEFCGDTVCAKHSMHCHGPYQEKMAKHVADSESNAQQVNVLMVGLTDYYRFFFSHFYWTRKFFKLIHF